MAPGVFGRRKGGGKGAPFFSLWPFSRKGNCTYPYPRSDVWDLCLIFNIILTPGTVAIEQAKGKGGGRSYLEEMLDVSSTYDCDLSLKGRRLEVALEANDGRAAFSYSMVVRMCFPRHPKTKPITHFKALSPAGRYFCWLKSKVYRFQWSGGFIGLIGLRNDFETGPEGPETILLKYEETPPKHCNPLIDQGTPSTPSAPTISHERCSRERLASSVSARTIAISPIARASLIMCTQKTKLRWAPSSYFLFTITLPNFAPKKCEIQAKPKLQSSIVITNKLRKSRCYRCQVRCHYRSVARIFVCPLSVGRSVISQTQKILRAYGILARA